MSGTLGIRQHTIQRGGGGGTYSRGPQRRRKEHFSVQIATFSYKELKVPVTAYTGAELYTPAVLIYCSLVNCTLSLVETLSKIARAGTEY